MSSSEAAVNTDSVLSLAQKWGYRILLWGNLTAFTIWIVFKLFRIFFKLMLSSQMLKMHKMYGAERKRQLFNHLLNLGAGKSSPSSSAKSQQLRVVEIGSGAGQNLDYYPDGTWLIAIEPFAEIRDKFEENISAQPRLRLEKYLTKGAEDMSEIPDSSVDGVVSTFVLCSVNNIDKVFQEIARILKPGGVFIFIEHVCPKSYLGQFASYLIFPITRGLFSCSFLRHPHTQIDSNRFHVTHMKESSLHAMFGLISVPIVELVAVKK